jgi:uncharacterized protein YggE
MRLVITGIALALAVPVLAGDAIAQAVSTAPLAPNEVLLELSSTGSVTTRADLVTVQVQINAQAATEEEARRAAEAQVRRVTQVARGAGVAAADVEAGEVSAMPMMDMMAADMNAMVMTENTVDMDMTEASTDTNMVMDSTANAAVMVEIRLRNVDRLEALTRALDDAGLPVIPIPVYALADPAAPRREARSRALAAARADAEAYAAALGLRVVRVARVSERVGTDFFSMMMNEGMMRRSMNGGAQNEPDIETSMIVGVDYVLAPR